MKLRTAAALAPTLAIVAGALVGVAGCGTTTELDANPVAAVQKAADNTRLVGSSKVFSEVTFEEGRSKNVLRSEGVYDFEKNLGKSQMDLPAPVSGKAESIVTSNALFVRGRTVSQPDKWRQFDFTKLGTDALRQAAPTDPSVALELLRGATENVKKVGEEDVDGVRTTHYEGALRVKQALGAAPSNSMAAMVGQSLGGVDELTIPFHAYLDEEGRVRKLQETMAFRTLFANKTSKVTTGTIVMILRDFGTPAEINVPTPAQVQRG